MASPESPPQRNQTFLKDLARNYEPWPLGTDAMVRILAWPDYTQPEEIRKVLQASSRLFGHSDACLCLRHDSSVDPPVSEVVDKINAELQQRPEVTERGLEINILIVDDIIPGNEWYRVGLTAFCAVAIKRSTGDIRSQFIDVQRCEKVHV
ncbi:MAG: hypothetical protein JXX14_00380 [Deltaproteobacteria bacterium]|nr:hypothetical protein [Deltaproteobacteria bacterium]